MWTCFIFSRNVHKAIVQLFLHGSEVLLLSGSISIRKCNHDDEKKIIMKCRRRGQNDRDLSYSQPFVRQISYIFNGQALIQTGLRECVLVYFRCGPYLPWRSYVCWTERAAGALCRCRTPQRPEQLLTNGKRKKRGKADEPVLLEGSWNSLCSCFYHQCSKGKTALFSHGYWLLTRPVKGYLSARYKVWGFNIQSLGTLFHCQLFLLPLRPLPWGQLHSAALNVLQPPLLLKSELQKMQLGTEKSLFWSGTREGGAKELPLVTAGEWGKSSGGSQLFALKGKQNDPASFPRKKTSSCPDGSATHWSQQCLSDITGEEADMTFKLSS